MDRTWWGVEGEGVMVEKSVIRRDYHGRPTGSLCWLFWHPGAVAWIQAALTALHMAARDRGAETSSSLRELDTPISLNGMM